METYSSDTQKYFNESPAKTLILWQFSEDAGRSWRNFADFEPTDVRHHHTHLLSTDNTTTLTTQTINIYI